MIADAVETLSRLGRMTVMDLVRCPTHEARLAFPELMRDVVTRAGGRLRWAGSVDQQLVGRGLDHYQDVLISEYPSGEACVRALLERRAWQPETFVDEIGSWAARPWSGAARIAARAAFFTMGLVTRSPAPHSGGSVPSVLVDEAGSGLDPAVDQLETLVDSEQDGRVVMINFLRYGSEDAEADGPTGEAAYSAYGRIAVPLIASLGGRLLYSATRMRVIEGDPESAWDTLAVVEYPSRSAFLGMLADPRYRQGAGLRRTGLDSTRLLVCTPHAAFH